MNEISDSALMAALGRQMTQAVAKQAVSASNLANIDTPNYRTKEVSFADVLNGEVQKQGLAVTNARHIGGGGADAPETVEARGLESRRDGNNVQIERELLAMGRASSEFATAQAALTAKFRLIRFAINDGK